MKKLTKKTVGGPTDSTKVASNAAKDKAFKEQMERNAIARAKGEAIKKAAVKKTGGAVKSKMKMGGSKKY